MYCMVNKFILIFFIWCQTQMFHFLKKKKKGNIFEMESASSIQSLWKAEMNWGSLLGSVSVFI